MMRRWCFFAMALCCSARRFAQEFGVPCKELDTTEIYQGVSDVLSKLEQRRSKQKNTTAAASALIAADAQALTSRLRDVACHAAVEVAELQAKITWKLRYLHWIARSDVALPFAWPSHAWLQIFNGTDSTDQRKSAKVMKYVHLSLILSYTVRQEATVALQKAAIGGDGGAVDVETDDLFVVISPAYAFFHKAIEKEGLDGGLCEVLDRGDAFGEAFHLFAQQVNVAQIAQFCPSPLDKAFGKTAYEVVTGEAPAPGDCGEPLECQQAADMFCPVCLHSDHLEGLYWYPVDMMAATVMNALAAGVGVTADHLDGLSKRCKHFFEGKIFGPKFH
ncbi:hypothetical protein AK812_SmicGene39971 [Symbiodinium microadriaticum]|uniref:Uncharacterized protein n=1 Tax=Symbiodinium microadriaticum TaxID=2951 RepID=A0A1Q9CA60_SYMMI|nr:hypothetical protein AK812_SmicGene39971 [Symbiodinium microadriaticum]